jgi:hypothetical protein
MHKPPSFKFSGLREIAAPRAIGPAASNLGVAGVHDNINVASARVHPVCIRGALCGNGREIGTFAEPASNKGRLEALDAAVFGGSRGLSIRAWVHLVLQRAI